MSVAAEFLEVSWIGGGFSTPETKYAFKLLCRVSGISDWICAEAVKGILLT